ncbi:MAG: multicopper oxidase domain-containing protein [Gemmatimonadaceae bacterium]
MAGKTSVAIQGRCGKDPSSQRPQHPARHAASDPGQWMLHCHIAEHLEAGMKMVFEVQ